MATEIDIAVTTTTYDVTITATPNEYIVNITTNAGGGIESVTGTTVDNTDPLNPVVNVPTMAQVLTIEDKVFDTIASDRTWIIADRLKYWQVQSGTQTLDDSADIFPNYSLIEGCVQNDDIDATVTFEFVDTNCFYLNANVTTVTLNVGDYFHLKKAETGAWILNVWNKGSGGGTQDLAMVLAIDNKTNEIPIISNNENGYAFILDDRTIVGNDFGGEKNIKFEEDTFTLNSTVRYLFNGKGIDIGTTSDGLGLPRLTTTQMNAIVAPTEGMIVYNTTESETYQYNGATWNALGGGAVDSVNGQTGVVVLDAGDVGAEPTKGSDDNYVTDAQLVVIGNTSGTNSGDNATNTKYEVAATTGAVISFATPQVYNSIASPSSSNLTDNLTGARIGIVQKIYHNAGTAPTVPAGWVLRGTGAYVTSTLNIIYAEWSVGTTVEYWITQ